MILGYRLDRLPLLEQLLRPYLTPLYCRQKRRLETQAEVVE